MPKASDELDDPWEERDKDARNQSAGKLDHTSGGVQGAACFMQQPISMRQRPGCHQNASYLRFISLAALLLASRGKVALHSSFFACVPAFYSFPF
jgi:hypothetical protein